MKAKRKQLMLTNIKALEDALALLRTNVRDSLITNDSAALLCGIALKEMLEAITQMFRKDAESPYEENTDVYFNRELWTIKDYEGDLLAIKKGNLVQIVKSSEVSLTLPPLA